MRIDVQNQSIDNVSSPKITNTTNKQIEIDELTTNNQEAISEEKLKQAIDSINEIYEINDKQLKFVYHEGLEQYFVQLVNIQTEEVVKEIPPKKLLDAFYEMQKLVGMIVDEKI